MAVVEVIMEIVGEIFIESIFFRGPRKFYKWLTGTTPIEGYPTETKKFIKFSTASKQWLAWETDTDHLNHILTNGLKAMNEKLTAKDFQLIAAGHRTIIKPKSSISFYSFHFLVQWLTEHKIQTVGLVETARTIYTTYNDPHSENLIGQTEQGKKFFISLMEDYSKRPFLRINRNIIINEEFDVLRITRELGHGR